MTPEKGLVEYAWRWLDRALVEADGPALLTSPYLSFSTCDAIAVAARDQTHPWILVTALDPRSVAGGSLSVNGLRVLLEAGVEIRHVDRLHSKCFIIGSRAMLGSANLTAAGLGRTRKPNRELGAELSGSQAEEAWKAISGWAWTTVGHQELDLLMDESKSLSSTPDYRSGAMDPQDAIRLAEQLLLDSRDPGRSLWMKLEYGEPALEGWREQSWFASSKRGKPKISTGDLVLICAKETSSCYAITEVTSDPEFQPRDYADSVSDREDDSLDRWPWINRTTPRLVPSGVSELKYSDLGVYGPALQNGHVRLQLDQFTAAVRALARLAGD